MVDPTGPYFFAERPWWPPLSLFGRRKGQGGGGRGAFGKSYNAIRAARPLLQHQGGITFTYENKPRGVRRILE